jgi:hypothetical protein
MSSPKGAPRKAATVKLSRRHLSSRPKTRYLDLMNTEQVLDEFRGAGALREGHFILASGRHSPMFLQKNLVFQYADRTERLCRALAEKIVAQFGKPDVIVAPPVGAESVTVNDSVDSSAESFEIVTLNDLDAVSTLAHESVPDVAV